MKKLSITLLMVLCYCFAAAEKIEGMIITNVNDTLKVTFDIPIELLSREPNYERLQYKVKYVDENGKKQTLKPDDAREIIFTYNNETVRMLSRLNTLQFVGGTILLSSGDNIFLKLVEDGPVQLFLYYYTQNTPGTINPSSGAMTGGFMYDTDRYILQKGVRGELKQIKGMSFRKDMAEYFADCPELVKKIEEKEFKREDMEAIVRFYNAQCGK